MKESNISKGDWVHAWYNTDVMETPYRVTGYVLEIGATKTLVRITLPANHDPILVDISTIRKHIEQPHPADLDALIDFALLIKDKEAFYEYVEMKRVYEKIKEEVIL